MKFLRSIFVGLYFLLTPLAFAQITSSNTEIFNINHAYAQLEASNKLLLLESASLKNLNMASKNLKDYRAKAKSCIEQSDGELTAVDKLVNSLKILSDQQAVQDSEEYKFLQAKKDFYAKQASDCRLFLFKSNESSEQLNKFIQQKSTFILLQPSAPFWKIFRKETLLEYKNIDINKGIELLGFNKITTPQWVYSIVILCFSLLVSLFLFLLSQRALKAADCKNEVLCAFLSSIQRFCIPVFLFGSLSAFFYIVFFGIIPPPTLLLISHFIFTYLLFVAILYFFIGYKKTSGLTAGFLNISRSLFVHSTILATIITFGLITAAFFRFQDLSVSLTNITLTLFYIPLTFVLVWTCWIFTKISTFKRTTRLLMKIMLSLVFVFIMLAMLFGFYRFSSYLISGVLSSLILSSVVMFLFYLIAKVDHAINDRDNQVAQKIRSYLGVKHSKKITEFFFIKITLYFTIIYAYVYYMMLAWGFSLNFLDKMKEWVFDGFNIANLHIAPLNIASALLSFSILMILGKWLSAVITKQYPFGEEKEAQSTIGTVIGYLNFFVALLLSLLISGVNLTGLAIVAGALSVGVGLGLQNIASNLFSGVLLLLDDDINPGDLVIINGVEGIIKKIKLRSTLITTFTKEDIIVPNAEFINNRVTNFNYRRGFGHIIERVTVNPTNDVDTVKNILLAAAQHHPEIIQEDPHQPRVLFSEFDRNSMSFNLLCTVRKVRIKDKIISDLNSEINKAFKNHNIT